VFRLLCPTEYKIGSHARYIKNDIFCPHTLLIKLWYNSLGQLRIRQKKIFIIQKKSIRIITNSKPRDSCRLHFKNFKIMTMYSQYIYSLIIHTVNNKHLYSPNCEIHKYGTRYNNNLHLPIANLTKYTEGPYFSAMKLYNHLPDYIKSLTCDQKRFKNTLKKFLCQHSFYSIQKYYEFKDNF